MLIHHILPLHAAVQAPRQDNTAVLPRHYHQAHQTRARKEDGEETGGSICSSEDGEEVVQVRK
jgi:hypothetical protein